MTSIKNIGQGGYTIKRTVWVEFHKSSARKIRYYSLSDGNLSKVKKWLANNSCPDYNTIPGDCKSVMVSMG